MNDNIRRNNSNSNSASSNLNNLFNIIGEQVCQLEYLYLMYIINQNLYKKIIVKPRFQMYSIKHLIMVNLHSITNFKITQVTNQI